MKYELAVLVLFAQSCSSALAATDAERIQQLEARLAEQDALIRSLAERLDRLAVVQSQPSAESLAAPMISRMDVPVITTSDGVTIKPRGRLQADVLLVNAGDGMTPTGTQLRRFQLGAEGKLGGGFRYSAEAAFAGGRVGLEDVLLAYQAGNKDEIVVGYFKPSITADDMTSDNYILFLERSAYASIFAPGRRIGVAYNHFGKNWGVRTSLSGERDDATLDGNRQEGWVAAIRAHANLLGQGNSVLHIAGSSFYTRSSSTERIFSFSQKPEANRALANISTGTIPASSAMFLGGEAAFGDGPFLLQVEGGTLRFQELSGSHPLFTGWSAQASWRLTGESRGYDAKSGVFGRVKPLSPVGDDGFGAVELGLRAGKVDLNDGVITAGRMTTLGGVINWYPVTHIRIGANIIRAKTEQAGLVDQDQTLVTIRAAVDW